MPQETQNLKSSKNKLLLRMLRQYLFPHKMRLFFAIFLMLMAAATTAAFAQLLQPIFDDVLSSSDQSNVLPVAFAVFSCLMLRGLTTYGHVLLMNKIGQEIVAKIQTELFEKLLISDVAFHQKHPSGSLITRLISDAQIMRASVSDSTTGLGKSFLTLIFLIGVMIYQDWQLSLACLVIFPIATFFLVYVGKRIRKVSQNTQEKLSGFSDKLSQVLQGVRQVKVYNKEAAESERMSDFIHEMKKLQIKAIRIGNLTTPVNDLLVGLVMFALIYYGGTAVLEERITAGSLVSFIGAFLLAYEPLKRISKLNASLNMGLGAADRVFEILDKEPMIKDSDAPKLLNSLKPKLNFDAVCFSYDDDKAKALENVTFTVNPGETVALVGPSGGGKSTIMNLVPRFFDPSSGKVLIDGCDVKALTLASLREHISYVSQDIVIFDETVSYNIRYGVNRDVSDEEIKEAAAFANATEFIESLPHGFDTTLGEQGTRLSGGQKQRIAIARAVLKNAPILLLDEATSALDNESEAFIQGSLEALRKNRTCLVVAHRLSTIRNADRILVIDRGRVIEEGSHDALIKKNGLYTTLHEK